MARNARQAQTKSARRIVLEWSKMLGFDQATRQAPEAKVGEKSKAKLGAKVGAKPGVKVGEKPAVKLDARLGSKVGAKDGLKPIRA